MTTASSRKPTKSEYALGIRDTLPVVIGVIPFGITYGVVGPTVGLSASETLLMSVLVFAGAAQFMSATMIGTGEADFSMIVFTTLLINLRHLLMGASLSPYMNGLSMRRQALLAFGMADESYAVTMDHIRRNGYDDRHQLGANSAVYFAWLLSTATGVFLGKYIPNPLQWGLDFAMPATFLAMLIPRLTDRKSLLVASAAAVTAVASAFLLPGKWYIITACMAASITGSLLERES